MFNLVKLKQKKASRCEEILFTKKTRRCAYQLRRKRDLVMFTGEKERELEKTNKQTIHTGF